MVQIDRPSPEAHWRDSGRRAKLSFIDAEAVFPFFLFLIHMKMWTFILALSAMILFTMLSKFGYSVPVFLRILRSLLAGKRKFSYPWYLWPNTKNWL